jgi:hypothetical protein
MKIESQQTHQVIHEHHISLHQNALKAMLTPTNSINSKETRFLVQSYDCIIAF